MHFFSSAVLHFRKIYTVILAPEHKTLCFCAANKFPYLARSRAAAFFFSEPCGLENTHGAVLHAHRGRAAVSTPNERAKSRETHFEKVRPEVMAYFVTTGASVRCIE